MRRTVRSYRKTALVKTNEGQIRGIRTNVEIPTFNNISNDNTNNNIITSSRRILNKRSITIYANNTNDKHNVPKDKISPCVFLRKDLYRTGALAHLLHSSLSCGVR